MCKVWPLNLCELCVFAKRLSWPASPPALVAPEVDMQPGAIAEMLALADLGDPPRALTDSFRRGPLGHQHRASALRPGLLQNLFDLGDIARFAHHEFQLIFVFRHQTAQHLRLKAQAVVLRRPALAFPLPRS